MSSDLANKPHDYDDKLAGRDEPMHTLGRHDDESEEVPVKPTGPHHIAPQLFPEDVVEIAQQDSAGVSRMDAINAHMSTTERCILFFSVFLVAYAYGLDGTRKLVAVYAFFLFSWTMLDSVLVHSSSIQLSRIRHR